MTLDIFFLVRDCFNAGDGFAVADIYIYIYIYRERERERERERDTEQMEANALFSQLVILINRIEIKFYMYMV